MQKKIINIIEKTLALVKLIGVKKTSEELNSIQKGYHSHPTIREFVEKKVCRKFYLSRKEFISGKSRTKTRFNARSVFSYIMIDEIDVQPLMVKMYLRCSASAITKYRNYIKDLNIKLKADKHVFDICEELKKDVKELIKKND